MEGQADFVENEDQKAFYLYCFTLPGKLASAVDLGVPGVDGFHNLELMFVGEIGALYSRVSLGEFSGPDAEISLQDPNWLVPRACRHEQAIESMMSSAPVFPVRFGAIFSSQQVLETLMRERQQEISHFLENTAGKEEWAVKGYLNIPKANDWLTSTDPTLAHQLRMLPEAPGARYLQNKRFQAELQKQVRQKCRSSLDQVHGEFQGLGVELLQLPLREPESDDREMVYHLAFLLSREGVVGFKSLVKKLNGEYGPFGIILECSGPWPPYHFCPSFSEQVP